MLRFRVTLRRYFDASRRISRGPINLFFPCRQDIRSELVEVGETRILEFALSEDDVAQLQHDYRQSNGSDAVKSFVNHQLTCGDSCININHHWSDIYDYFVVASVQQLHGEEEGK
jgi:hypothetical protein